MEIGVYERHRNRPGTRESTSHYSLFRLSFVSLSSLSLSLSLSLSNFLAIMQNNHYNHYNNRI